MVRGDSSPLKQPANRPQTLPASIENGGLNWLLAANEGKNQGATGGD
jgi:hypothetical protein